MVTGVVGEGRGGFERHVDILTRCARRTSHVTIKQSMSQVPNHNTAEWGKITRTYSVVL